MSRFCSHYLISQNINKGSFERWKLNVTTQEKKTISDESRKFPLGVHLIHSLFKSTFLRKIPRDLSSNL